MLKKLLTATLLLIVTSTANAATIGINGSFDVFGIGTTTLDTNGQVTQVDFALNSALNPVLTSGDYSTYLTSTSVFSVFTPLLLNNIVGQTLWTIEGFTFVGTSVAQNSSVLGGATGLYIIGDVMHNDFITTSTEWFFSTQFLNFGGATTKSFSSTVTSPAPQRVPETGSLAIFCLGLAGLALRRKAKKSA